MRYDFLTYHNLYASPPPHIYTSNNDTSLEYTPTCYQQAALKALKSKIIKLKVVAQVRRLLKTPDGQMNGGFASRWCIVLKWLLVLYFRILNLIVCVVACQLSLT